MNSRERYLKTLTFGHTDRIPFMPGGARESTLKTWRKQGLPENVDYLEHLCGLLHIDSKEAIPSFIRPAVSFNMMPEFEEKILEHKDGHYVVQDWKGNICEISDTFDVSYLRGARDFVTRRWIKCPVETRDDWEKMKLRYNPDEPGRFPADFEEKCLEWNRPGREALLKLTVNGPFWQLREWLGFEGLCMMLADDPELVREMAAFWTDFISAVMKPILARTSIDHILINEDMAYKSKPMISPAMTREFIAPAYDRWIPEVRAAGCRVIEVDSDGFVDDLIPIWINSGITCCSPMEVAAGCNLNAYRGRFGNKMAYMGGVDKRLMAKGGSAIEGEIRRLSPVVKSGGYIPGCDHGVPSDVSWPHFVEYARLLAKETGWN